MALIAVGVPFFAFAKGGVYGGANAVDYRLIEAYHRDLNQVPGYSEAMAKLNEIRPALPIFVKFLEDRLANVYWYEVPADKLTNVGTDATELLFDNQQVCYQPKNTDEIVCSSLIHDEMYRRDPVEAGRAIVHEAVMALQREAKLSPDTRAVINEMYATKPDPIRIQNALAKHHFGGFFTTDQKKLIRAMVPRDYLRQLSAKLKEVESLCHEPAEVGSLLEIKLRLNGIQDRANAPLLDDRDFAIAGRMGVFYSPFRSIVVSDGLANSVFLTTDFLGTEGDRICLEYPAMIGRAMWRELESDAYSISHSIDKTEEALRLDAAEAEARGGSKTEYEAELLSVKEKLSENSDFMTIVALMIDPTSHSLWNDEGARRWLGPGASLGRKILDQALSLRQSLPVQDEASARNLLCNSAHNLKVVIDKMVTEEEAKLPPRDPEL